MPRFLSVAEVWAIHDDQIERYGGKLGCRDVAGLASAVAMPQSGYGDEYFHQDLFAMAAAYVYHIVASHPFVDGNKRTGMVVADTSTQLNGYEIPASAEDAFEAVVLAVARGDIGKPEVAGFLRQHAVPLTDD